MFVQTSAMRWDGNNNKNAALKLSQPFHACALLIKGGKAQKKNRERNGYLMREKLKRKECKAEKGLSQ